MIVREWGFPSLQSSLSRATSTPAFSRQTPKDLETKTRGNDTPPSPGVRPAQGVGGVVSFETLQSPAGLTLMQSHLGFSVC